MIPSMAGATTGLSGITAQLAGPPAYRRAARNKLAVVAQGDKSERWRPRGDRSIKDSREAPAGGTDAATRTPTLDRRPKTVVSKSGMKLKKYIASDGQEHLGSALRDRGFKPFPGPPGDKGPPLRVLPIGGLGEIGMNCMMAGVRDRFVLIDAGLMFPDFSDLGMQKVLPDTRFLAQWKDRIEAVIITHGHEDHIGALPWVLPALDPSTPVYASSFVMELIKRRLCEYSLWNETRFKTFKIRERFQAGPFEVEPVRVTHSIPESCGVILRNSEGTMVHTGDWKIDESPLDGLHFDRELFASLAAEPVALMMSDSTNVLAPGRTASEKVVHDSLIEKVLAHNGKGRVICTQFASNLHRLYGVKRAAEASGRRICFVGASLSHYLEAAWQDGRAPFEPRELLQPEELRHADPNQVLVVTTGSQGEPRAQLSMAAIGKSNTLKILPGDLVLYSAKVIPGNEGKVVKMLNALAEKGARVRQSRADNLHTSGHAYQEELLELLRLVRPQHFLPVHGEYAFLTEHAALAQEKAGVRFVDVIRNGELLAVRERRNRNTVSTGSMAVASLAAEAAAAAAPVCSSSSPPQPTGGRGQERGGPAEEQEEGQQQEGKEGNVQEEEEETMIKYDAEEPTYFYNDGGKGTGTREEMQIDLRTTMATEGVVVVAVDVRRTGAGAYQLGCNVRVTARGLWTDGDRLLQELSAAVEDAVSRKPGDTPLVAVERTAIDVVKKHCDAFNKKRPEVIAMAYEHDPRDAHLAAVAEARAAEARAAGGRPSTSASSPSAGSPSGVGNLSGDAAEFGGILPRRVKANPWEKTTKTPTITASGSSGSSGPTSTSSSTSGAGSGVLRPGAARRTRLPATGGAAAAAAAAPSSSATAAAAPSQSGSTVVRPHHPWLSPPTADDGAAFNSGGADEASAGASRDGVEDEEEAGPSASTLHEVPAQEAAAPEAPSSGTRVLRARQTTASARTRSRVSKAATAADGDGAGGEGAGGSETVAAVSSDPPPADAEEVKPPRRRTPREKSA